MHYFDHVEIRSDILNLSQIKISLKAENIQSFINDFVKVDGVMISDIKLCDDMILINKIKYKSFGAISIGLKLERIQDGVLSITIKKLKAISIPISVIPVNFILKMVLNKVDLPGVFCDGKCIQVDLGILLEKFEVDFLSLDIKDISINNESIDVVVGNLDFDMDNLIKKSKKNEKPENQEQYNEVDAPKIKVVNQIDFSSQRVNDYQSNYFIKENNEPQNFNYKESDFVEGNEAYFSQYSRVRNGIYNEKFENSSKEIFGKILFVLPDIGVLCYRLLRDKRIKKGLKILLVFTLSYLLNPFDVINTKISILNKIDDTLLLIFTLNKVFISVDRRILESYFDGSSDTLDFLIDSFDVLNQFLGGDRINKLYSVVEKFVK